LERILFSTAEIEECLFITISGVECGITITTMIIIIIIIVLIMIIIIIIIIIIIMH